jgi:hypothetical protein
MKKIVFMALLVFFMNYTAYAGVPAEIVIDENTNIDQIFQDGQDYWKLYSVYGKKIKGMTSFKFIDALKNGLMLYSGKSGLSDGKQSNIYVILIQTIRILD